MLCPSEVTLLDKHFQGATAVAKTQKPAFVQHGIEEFSFPEYNKTRV
jgi:hypothetical protein